MRDDIIRIEDRGEFGLAHRYVFGLNLFNYNRVPCPIERRPDVVFLARLTERRVCAAQVAALFLKDHVDTPEEMFGAPAGPDAETPYHEARHVGFYDGFFDLQGGIPFTGRMVEGEWVPDDEPRYGDCFFPRVTPAFWRAVEREEGSLDQLLFCHGLVLYVGPTAPDAGERMARLLDAPFSTEETFLRAVADLYAVAPLVGHDGQFFHAYARDAANFTLLDAALADAVRVVEESDWYRANRDRLAWSKVRDACLMLHG